MRSWRRCGLGLVALMGLTACQHYRFAGTRHAPAGEDCTFHLVDDWPYRGYEQIGVVDLAKGHPPARSHNEFWHDIQSEVCQAGGEVVIAQVNGVGMYIRGIVLRRVDAAVGPPPASGPITTPPDSHAPPPPPAPSEARAVIEALPQTPQTCPRHPPL